MDIQETYLMLLHKAILLGKSEEGRGKREEGRGKNISEDLPGDFVDAVVQLAQRHGTGPLVFNELLKTLSDSPSKGDRLQAMSMQMKQICMQNMLLQGQWEQVIKKTFQTLEQGGVQAVLMKGFAYARLYPLPYLRSWGDLDIWVGPEQYHQACGLLREAFPEAKHHDEEWDELKHYCFVFPDGKSIELHRVSMDFLNKKDQAYWCELEKEAIGDRRQDIGDRRQDIGDRRQAIGERLEVNGIEVPMWEAKFDILFCFMHSWEHFCGSGIPLKQVCDLALLVKQAIGDRRQATSHEELEEYLEKHLKKLKMLEVWKYYGYMACKALGVAASEWPLLGDRRQDIGDRQQAIGDRRWGKVVKYGERLYERVMKEGQCRERVYGVRCMVDGVQGKVMNRYEAREEAKKMNLFARKILTLKSRLSSYYFLKEFAPKYARHILAAEIKKGIKRTLTGAKMIDY